MNKIEKVAVLTVGTQAQTVRVNGLPCLIQNNSAAADVFFKERRDDGADVTGDNGWRLGPGESTLCPLVVRELSVIAGAEDTDVRVLILDEE